MRRRRQRRRALPQRVARRSCRSAASRCAHCSPATVFRQHAYSMFKYPSMLLSAQSWLCRASVCMRHVCACCVRSVGKCGNDCVLTRSITQPICPHFQSYARSQIDLYGALTQTEERRMLEHIQAVSVAPSFSAQTERQLLAAADANPYHRALVLIGQAPLHSATSEQARLLSEAAEDIRKCAALEASLLDSAHAAAQPPRERRVTRPGAPVLLSRSADSVTVAAPRLAMKGASSAETFAVYCKPFGAGVALSVNRTAMEYEGTGEKVGIGERVTVRHLRPNAAYVFAVAAYDSHGKLIGELGALMPAFADL